ncbi:MAG: hypothetical protein LBG08_07655, partial [Spirochaetaceae bacterium]|nr:hypothetical protein [Spirochaetaceae bacterium]
MKIGKKLISMIIILNLTGTIALAGTILALAQKQIRGLINNEMTNLAKENALEIRTWLELYLDTARSIGQVMSNYEEIDREERRYFFNTMIRTMVEKNPDIFAASSVWEPNALDGLDAEFANTAGTDHTGRFIPYWFRGPAGVTMEPLADYDVPGVGDYHLIPKQTGNETVIEPYYEYDINGHKLLVTTLVMPIKNKGRFVGSMGIDIEITAIQQQVEEIKPYEKTIAVVYSNGGLVSGHFDPSRVGKPMAETEKDIAGPYLDDLR